MNFFYIDKNKVISLKNKIVCQSKILRVIVNGPFYVSNHTLHGFFILHFISKTTKKKKIFNGVGTEKLTTCIIWREGRPLAPLCHCSINPP